VRFDPHPPEAGGAGCFARATANSDACNRSWENSTLFVVALGQFLIAAAVVNRASPHRAPMRSNPWLVAALGAQSLFLLAALLAPGGAFSEGFAGLKPFPSGGFKAQLLLLLLANLAAAWAADVAVAACTERRRR
jgi:hypothetical protein